MICLHKILTSADSTPSNVPSQEMVLGRYLLLTFWTHRGQHS